MSDKSISDGNIAWIAVIVAGLGYFVDVFDVWLFSNNRIPSLKSLGLSPEDVTLIGAQLLNWQQGGLLIGGILWGILGDKRGRTTVMFGSIFVYSVATFANAFVTSIEQYAALRFISGVGLAGEIGAGITLVCELLPKEQRGWGTTVVTGLGVTGAVGTAFVTKFFSWQSSYLIGGIMGFCLLFLRIAVSESEMFNKLKRESSAPRGSLLMLFGSPKRLGRYLCCIFAGMPIFVVFALYVSFAPELASALGINEPLTVPDVMIWGSIGMTVGDLLAGSLSQILKSRRKPIFIFMSLSACTLAFLLCGPLRSASSYAKLVGLAGIFSGLWACVITTAAEQFGTNLRATVATTVPNFVRGSSILLVWGFTALRSSGVDTVSAVSIISIVGFSLSFLGVLLLNETYGKDLDYVES